MQAILLFLAAGSLLLVFSTLPPSEKNLPRASQKERFFESGAFSLNYSGEPLESGGNKILLARGSGCNISVEKRPLSGGGVLFESFSRLYSGETGEPLLYFVLGTNRADFKTEKADYSVLFCENAAFVLRKTPGCAASASCQE